MKKHIIILLIHVIAFTGCSKENKSDNTFGENRMYKSLNFESEDECDEVNANSEIKINCYSIIDFNKDGSVSYMETDIIYSGTYTIKNNNITITLVDIAVVELGVKTLSFLLINENTLEGENKKVWTRSTE